MEISITAQEKKNYLLIQTKANIETKEELLEQSQLIFAEIIKYDYKKILVYQPETHLPDNLYAFFDLVKSYTEDFPPAIRELKIASVVAPEYKELADTWETLCRSRKLNTCAFTSLERAKAWLLKDNK